MDVLYWLNVYQDRLQKIRNKEGREPTQEEKDHLYDQICEAA